MKPAAKAGDAIVAEDFHVVVSPSGVASAVPLPFRGTLATGLSGNVLLEGRSAALEGSAADNDVPHVPPGGTFQKPPSNKGTVQTGSATVLINGRPAARHGDPAMTCNDPEDQPVGQVEAGGTVLVGR